MNRDKHRLRRSGKPALDLIEEGVSLVRHTPVALLTFFVGAVPFWLGLLYYLSDMSRSADAAAYITEAAFGVALLFLWVKCWETVFCAQLRASLLGEPDEPWTWRRVGRLVAVQATVHPWSLILRPMAVVITLPYVWVSSFFQNVTVLGDGRSSADQSTFMAAFRQAKLWPGQAHVAVSFLWAFSFFVWLNVVALLVFLPMALKTFFGMETVFSRGSTGAYLNTTFLTASVALTSLCVQPLWKACYVLRCFYGISLRSGDDLKLQLKNARRALVPLTVAVLAVICFWPASTHAQDVELETPAADAPQLSAEASDLDAQIREVLDRREFSWRAPREKLEESEEDQSWLATWMKSVTDVIERWFKQAGRAMDRFFKWLFQRMSMGGKPSTGMDWSSAMLGLAWLALIAAALGLAWVLWRLARSDKTRTVAAAAIPTMPDLHSEDVAADQLPEEGWMELAREHASRGDLVLALRAAWLASLAHLGRRELLTIARHKSNREYQRELRRRAISQGELVSAFGDNLATFERAWYGCHRVTPRIYERFTGNFERMREC